MAKKRTPGLRKGVGPARGEGAGAEPPRPPDPEVPEGAKRRRFSRDSKLRVLQEADRCRAGGAAGAVAGQGVVLLALDPLAAAAPLGGAGRLAPPAQTQLDPMDHQLVQMEEASIRSSWLLGDEPEN